MLTPTAYFKFTWFAFVLLIPVTASAQLSIKELTRSFEGAEQDTTRIRILLHQAKA